MKRKVMEDLIIPVSYNPFLYQKEMEREDWKVHQEIHFSFRTRFSFFFYGRVQEKFLLIVELSNPFFESKSSLDPQLLAFFFSFFMANICTGSRRLIQRKGSQLRSTCKTRSIRSQQTHERK
jgi:hypothetical protein